MKTSSISPIIKVPALAALLIRKKVKLIDARVGADIKNVFQQNHLTGAIHVDLERDMADKKPNAADGGRHPLLDIQKFAQLLGALGIDTTTHVVVYDDKNGANAAARFWWMLKAVGHEKVQVLDGGFQEAIEQGIPTSSVLKRYRHKSVYPANSWQLPIASMDEVEQAAQDPHFVVIDVRDAERYRGEKEPIDLIAGHIPGAINVPFSNNLDENGLFLSKEALKKQYETVIANRTSDKVIVHCGSGVTACHTLLAMAYAGFSEGTPTAEIPKLYVGSWSEWSRNDKEIGLGG